MFRELPGCLEEGQNDSMRSNSCFAVVRHSPVKFRGAAKTSNPLVTIWRWISRSGKVVIFPGSKPVWENLAIILPVFVPHEVSIQMRALMMWTCGVGSSLQAVERLINLSRRRRFRQSVMKHDDGCLQPRARALNLVWYVIERFTGHDFISSLEGKINWFVLLFNSIYLLTKKTLFYKIKNDLEDRC